MKKFVTLFVLLVFLVNAMGYFIVFRCNQYLIRQEMIGSIRNGSFHQKLVALKVAHPENDPRFRRTGQREFSYDGNLYDLVSERKTGDVTVFYCLRDIREEQLILGFTVYLRHTNNSPRTAHPLQALLYNLITQALVQSPGPALRGEGIAFKFPPTDLIIHPVYLAHSAPPPKAA